MDTVSAKSEKGLMKAKEVAETPAATVVFQPQKLTDVLEMIDLMGTIAERVRDDRSGDASGSTGKSGKAAQKAAGVSARDAAINNAPPVPIMQQKLKVHIAKEIRALKRQASLLSHSRARGSAYLLNEIYRKIRRLTALTRELLKASAEVIRRFFISVFIDGQPIVVSSTPAGKA